MWAERALLYVIQVSKLRQKLCGYNVVRIESMDFRGQENKDKKYKIQNKFYDKHPHKM
jgi:hypothetical protein